MTPYTSPVMSKEKKKQIISKKSKSDPLAKEIAHYNAILIEDLKDQFKFVIEHVSGVEERLTKRMDERFVAHDQRFDIIESVLTQHSKMLQANEERWNQNEERWNQNDFRLDRIETKLDSVIETVKQHHNDIQELKKAAS